MFNEVDSMDLDKSQAGLNVQSSSLMKANSTQDNILNPIWETTAQSFFPSAGTFLQTRGMTKKKNCPLLPSAGEKQHPSNKQRSA